MTPAVALVVSGTPESKRYVKRMNIIASRIKWEHGKKAVFLNTLVIPMTILFSYHSIREFQLTLIYNC